MSERFEIKDLEEALGIVGTDDVKKVISEFKKELTKEINFTGIYTSRKDILESIKERVSDYFNSEYSELKRNISYVRKHGEEVSVIDYELMTLPLKLKLLEVTFDLDNYYVVLGILKSVRDKLSGFEVN
ncbi:MAG: hypothetical protein PF542_03350 [Nanoarchaeota archaeon]|jgi:hypothetical protein|nr:hypothetical protein [Nanoarchaeota archaeon]